MECGLRHCGLGTLEEEKEGAEATRSKDNRDGEGKKSSQEMGAREAGGGGGRVTEGRRKRLIHAALALDRVLLPGSNKTFFFFFLKEINILI